ncbi:putative ABC multidrug transporter [Apiosordaria backusii]|uniref:ABC multidrug transporter n=1 Tax=Apiosordaria backusii TaxID=314023 RepID=A0AA40E8U1_9PEZI|nr:putative ABC multidrug transporter [Apiosordaria backusii]
MTMDPWSEDAEFGPALSSSFDFTLVFEQLILQILPSTGLLIASFWRLWFILSRKSRRISPNGPLYWSKVGLAFLLFSLYTTALILWALSPHSLGPVAIVASALSAINAIVLAVLLDVEHRTSVKPSLLVGGYLLISTLLDLAQARSLWLRPRYQGIASVFIVTIITKTGLLILEELPKLPPQHDLRKEAGPESISGAANRSVFGWINALFLRGHRSLIGLTDLPTIPPKFRSSRLLKKIERYWSSHSHKTKHALCYTTFRTFMSQTLWAIPPRLCFSGLKFAQPFLIKRVVEFVGSSPDAVVDANFVGGLIGATLLVYTGLAISNCIYHHLTYQLITMVRGALVGLIYGKITVLDSSTLIDAAPLTHMSTDIDGIAAGLMFLHDIWASVLELGVGVYLLYREIGIPCFLVVIPISAATILTEQMSIRIVGAKIAWNQGVQSRVSSTSSMLGQMKGLKMTGLSGFFSSRISCLRQSEIGLSKKYRLLITLNEAVSHSVLLFTPIIVITGTVFWTNSGSGNSLPIAQAFTTLSIVMIVAEPLAMLVALRSLFGAALGCFIRIQEFILQREQSDGRQISRGRHMSEKPNEDDLVVDIRDACFKTAEDVTLLSQVNMQVPRGTFHIVTGSVGSGKSSLLKAILGEVLESDGSTTVRAAWAAYCAQTPWLRNSSIRENIVGISEFNFETAWYSTVISACALDQDFGTVEEWDRRAIGSAGMALSGGQKQRVALARAVYSRKALVLLDDVFSGLDNSTSDFVFHKLFGSGGILQGTGQTAVLVTNQARFFAFADALTTVDSGTISTVDKASLTPGKDSILATKQPEKADEDSTGTITSPMDEAIPTEAQDTSPTDASRQAGDLSLYKYYLMSVGWGSTAIFFAAIIITSGLGRMPEVWLRVWTERGAESGSSPLYYAIYLGFGICGLLAVVGTFAFYYLRFIPASAKQLHSVLLNAVLRAPLSFFTKTDAGVTINRFSQDMALVDQQLPMSFLAAVFLACDVTVAAILVVSGAKYTAACIPVVLIVLYILQRFYLRTSRQMRFLDLEAKSPLYTLFTETLAGAVTVRAFGWKEAFAEENNSRLDISQKPYYLMYCLQRWLNVVLDLVVAGIAVVLVAVALSAPGASSQGAIGLSMLSLIGFSRNLAALVSVWTTLETSLGAIARVRSFTNDTPTEEVRGEMNVAVPEGWPAQGGVQVHNVTAGYSDDTDDVLKNVTLDIKAGSKVAICGRTGSGKSSLLLAILRLLQLKSGTICIDGVNVANIPLETIRTSLTALPQDSVSIQGCSVRTNLAPPNSEVSDEELIAALNKAGLWNEVVSVRGGLDADFDSLNLSPGQRQLFSLAAATLRKSKVVLLDEITGSVDFETDAKMRRMMEKEFAGCTVLEVVHRIEMIEGYDLVVVMDGGMVVEVGKPGVLLPREGGSRFKELWDAKVRA